MGKLPTQVVRQGGDRLSRRDTPGILNEIVEVKREEVERLKLEVPVPALERAIETQKPPLNLAGVLSGPPVRIIAEVKRASPAKGLLRPTLDPIALATAYADAGAAAISVLTNADHFRGSLDDLDAVRSVANTRGVPVLRKEFIFDPYQVYESRAHGADAILLIAAVLDPGQLREMRELAESFWMQCVVEVHDEAEMKVALDSGAEIVGINNRDLRTFKTDLEVTERLAPLVPESRVIVSESGIATRGDVERVRRAGAHAVLVGEALIRAEDPGLKLGELLGL